METNKEHYAKEIVEIGLSGSRVALVNNEPVCCNEENCCDCELGGKDGCNLDKLRKWGNQEYHESIPQLTDLEIEELTYLKHHDWEILYFNFGVWIVRKEGLTRYIECNCNYLGLNKSKIYKISDLLEGQNVK